MSTESFISSAVFLYFIFYYMFCFSMQCILFFVIYAKTPQYLKRMKYFFYPTNTSNCVLATLSTFAQIRLISNQKSLAVLCQGPIRLLGPMYCFSSYIVLVTNGTVTGLLNIHTLYFKMLVIRGITNAKFRVRMFCLWYSFSVAALAFSFIPDIDFHSVNVETRLVHPLYNYEPYGDFGGFANSHNPISTVVTVIGCVLGVSAPAIAFYWRRLCLAVLKLNRSKLSAQTLAQFESLVNALGFQAMIPLVVYLPGGAFFVYNKYTAGQLIIPEFTFQIFGSLTAIFDPIIIFYYVAPYRSFLKQLFCWCSGKQQRLVIGTIMETTKSLEATPKNDLVVRI